MGSVASFISDTISGAFDAIADALTGLWDSIITPMLEEVFGWFGIEDETAVIVNKTSVMLFADNTEDVVHKANVKAVMSMTLEGGSFFPLYMQYTRVTASQIKGFHRYAEQERYVHGLPTLSVKGIDVDYAALDAALNTEKGPSVTRLSNISQFPSDEIYFKNILQATPYFYIPWANTLTFTDPYGASWDDYELDELTYFGGTNTYEYGVSRVAEEALFWIEGPVHIVEGDSATYTVTSNRAVPVGESVTVNMTYGGTASGSDYTAVATAVILAGNTTVQFTVTTNEDVASQGSRTIIVTLDSITNTNAAFEAVGVGVLNAVTTTITDDEGLILTMPSVLVAEVSGSAVIPVKLEAAAAGAFIVNYGFTDGTAIGGGVDYDSTPGVLNFAGTLGEVQNITVPITTADGDDDKEYFTVNLTACDDPLVDITQTATVTITDDTEVDPAPGTVVLSDVVNFAGYTSKSSMVVTYHHDADPDSEWFYWIYKYSDNTYPDIDPTMSAITDLDMLPIGILRHDKTSINIDKSTEEYKTTKRLIDYLGFNMDDMIDNIEENDYISDVTDCFLNLAASPNSVGEKVSKIMYLQFYEIIVVNTIESNSGHFSMSFSEQDVQNATVWSDHTHTPGISGTLANGQEYEHEVEIIPEIEEELVPGEGLVITQEQSSNLYIRYQTGPGLYDEIYLKNLNSMAAIQYNGYHDLAFNKVGDDNFTIPLSYAMLKRLDPLEMMVLYQDIIRLDMYSLQVVEIAWYQTQGFMNLFQFAMIVITVLTAGLASGPLAILQQLLVNYLIVELVIFLAERTGNAELAAIVGIVAMIYLGDATGMATFDFATAEGLINASTQFANNLTTAYDVEMQGIKEDIEDLNVKATERLEEIKEADTEQSPIDAEFLVALKSVDTTVFPAVKAQYNYDLLYNYDILIKQYHDNRLQIGVV